MPHSQYILLVDTAIQARVSVAVVKQNRFVYRRTVSVRHHGAEAVLPLVASLLRRPAFAGRNVSGVAVTSGGAPSDLPAAARERGGDHAVAAGFTHLRAAVVVANALAYALQIHAVGVSSRLAVDPEILVQALRAGPRPRRRRVIAPVYVGPPSITKRRAR